MPEATRLPLCRTCIDVFDNEPRTPFTESRRDPRRRTKRMWHEDGAHFFRSVLGLSNCFQSAEQNRCDLCLFVWHSLKYSDMIEILKLSTVRYGPSSGWMGELLLARFSGITCEPIIEYKIEKHENFNDIYVWTIMFPVPVDDDDADKAAHPAYHPKIFKKEIYLRALEGKLSLALISNARVISN
jgi:hypothetical protein